MSGEFMSNFGEQRAITVIRLNDRAKAGWLFHAWSQSPAPLALGRAGLRYRKSEGDGATPRGIWHPLEVFYRADKTRRPHSRLKITPIRPSDGWCDQPGDRNYNRQVKLPYPASHERLWRDDDMYDLIVVLDHNQRPRIQGRGSAIFMHVAKPGFTPTEGCLAFTRQNLHRLITQLTPATRIII